MTAESERSLWAVMFGLENACLFPPDVEAAMLSKIVGPDEPLWDALQDYFRSIADAHGELLRVYRSSGRRFLRFLEQPRALHQRVHPRPVPVAWPLRGLPQGLPSPGARPRLCTRTV